jgi:quercetin dioxygenase-like cupin family protein
LTKLWSGVITSETELTTEGAAMQTATKTAVWFLNNLAVVHARSEDTAGHYSVVEVTGAPGDMPPLHVHPHDDEGFYLLEGGLRLHVGGDTIDLRPGDFALAPRGVPHVYAVDPGGPARWLATSNGGFDRFVLEVGEPAAAPTLPPEPRIPDPAELTATAARHGIEILGPPGALPA